MKLVISREFGRLYVVRESNKHHEAVQKLNMPLGRADAKRVDPRVLGDDCDVSNISGDFYMVFDIKKGKK
jgi:hypothetical protein